MSTLTDAVASTTPVVSFSPVTLDVPGRPVTLQLRVTVPAVGTELPVVLLSHGHGPSHHLSSLNGYAPLAHAWAARGFVVLQPTHLSSRSLAHLVADAPGAPFFWRSRAEDMSHVIDRLGEVEAAVPGLAGRVDRTRIGLAGHSLGGFTASQLLGAGITDPESGGVVRLAEPRIGAGVLLASPGRGGDALNGPMGREYPIIGALDFSTMTTPALVVAGDRDDSRHFTDLGPEWHADPYRLSPGPKTLLTLFGAEHGLGGIAGYDAAETTDESPSRVTALADLTAAYLRDRLYGDSSAWDAACAALLSGPDAVGRAESK
ncbi:alpha/beta hydrolase family protein [Streptomyces sp. NPDC060194]|uniref:alpha/beta hydrolase family protein n=1 Tax=Streptomyces sp. NPDC060194 TaxID=3347069 RepID=UPI00364CF62C